MAKRKIIKIDENKCNGCGQCIPNCAEGALQMIDGKARLISDLFCDGLGACIGHCPEGAITIEEREAEPYNEYQVMEKIAAAGENVITAHLKHLAEHKEYKLLEQAKDYLRENNISIPKYDDAAAEVNIPCGCPGVQALNLSAKKSSSGNQEINSTERNIKLESKLRQWPVQLQLLNPQAQYFENADLLIAADCVAYSYADFHRRFLDGKILIILCPKLDKGIDLYIDKLTEIFRLHNIKSITIARMEVPCCGGVEVIVQRALEKSGKNIIIKEYTISIDGEII
ncbi:MAG TPA: 4Fe-4S binding protein [bacterium]|nr:4Fe-4S binding protein [bacterium]